MTKVKIKLQKKFTRKEMLKHKDNIYDYILNTLLEMNAPIEIKPMKNVLDAYELREMKVIGAFRRVDNPDFSIEYHW